MSMRRLCHAVVLVAVAACGPSGPGPASTSKQPSSSPSGDPLAARSICEAECRRAQRCGHGIDPQSCHGRCATLPVRMPPAWRSDFTAMVVGCMDRSTCATDDDERCILLNLAAAPMVASERACLDLLQPSQRTVFDRRGRTCFLYSGLTLSAERWFAGCIAAQRSPEACEPPLDWK